MYIPFDDMPKNSRIWIYQANRELSNAEIDSIEEISRPFFDQWAAHGDPLKSSFKILYSRFLIISVDESYNMASGCSIDASVSIIRTLEAKLGVDFFDRSQVMFLANNEIFSSSIKDLKSSIASGVILESTITFNNLISNVGQLENEWLVPASDSWLKRYF